MRQERREKMFAPPEETKTTKEEIKKCKAGVYLLISI